MNFNNNGFNLIIFLEGQINSYNADNVEKEIISIVENEQFKKLLLDFSDVSYISSAGLRIILKLKQKFNNVSVINTSLEVYDVFSMTGFVNIMEVKKALRRVFISGAEMIGSGYYSSVYRINKDTIIKVFNFVDDEEQIARELRLAKEAFILGIPTAISFDIVRVDNKLGVCFEMLDCDSLQNVVIKNPDKLGEYVIKYANLLKKMNNTECHSEIVPSIKDRYFSKLEAIKDRLPEDLFNKASHLLKAVPDTHTLVHGDCHFKNIMVQGDDLLLIDMETLSVGHPIFELAGLYSAYIGFNEYNPEESMDFFGISSESARNLFDALMKKYFANYNDEIKDKISLVSYISVYKWYCNRPEYTNEMMKYKEKLIDLLNKYNDLDIGI